MAKRRRIPRWDRIVVTAVILVVLIFLLGSCMRSCSSGGGEESSTLTQRSGSAADNSTDASSSDDSSASAGADDTSSAASTDSALSTADSLPETTPAAADIPSDYEYVTMLAGAVYSGPLVLVNSSNPSHLDKDALDLEQVYYSADRPTTYEISYPGHTTLNKTATTQFNRLMKAYYAATNNNEIMFNYGYLEAGKDHSNPESATGLDVQLHLKFANGGYDYISNVTPYSWVFEHMASYGFILRYPEDKAELTGEKGTYTAIRYVGVPHAAYITEHNLCLEEYLQMLKNEYQFGQNILTFSTAEQSYRIYYVPASATGDTSVPVPSGGTCEISGNNVDGFIVTAYAG